MDKNVEFVGLHTCADNSDSDQMSLSNTCWFMDQSTIIAGNVGKTKLKNKNLTFVKDDGKNNVKESNRDQKDDKIDLSNRNTHPLLRNEKLFYSLEDESVDSGICAGIYLSHL